MMEDIGIIKNTFGGSIHDFKINREEKRHRTAKANDKYYLHSINTVAVKLDAVVNVIICLSGDDKDCRYHGQCGHGSFVCLKEPLLHFLIANIIYSNSSYENFII